MKNPFLNQFYKPIAISIMTLTIMAGGTLVGAQAQSLPDDAVLPEGKGAWAVDQNFKTNIAAGTFLMGYIRVIVLSDGKVFHRKSFDNGTPATPWCQDKFTAAEMRAIISAVAAAKPAGWQRAYGQWLGLLAPFRNITLTKLDQKGEVIHYGTLINNDNAMPGEIAKIAIAVDAAGNLAFSNCAKSLPNSEPVTDKIENGTTIYAVNGKGDLLWYNHSGFENGERTWANNAKAKNVGYEWSGNVKAFKGDPRGKDGVVYTVSQEGYLSWYKHTGYASGSGDWETPLNVGVGFNGRYVFSGGSGVIYMIDNAGDVYWYKHLGYQTGAKTWANNGIGQKIGTQWNDARQVFAGGDGVIYFVDSRGDLYWNKHLGFRDGTNKWQERKKIGSGWQNFRQIFSGGDGLIYALKTDGSFYWYKHLDTLNGTNSWANTGAPKTIGSGWNFNLVF